MSNAQAIRQVAAVLKGNTYSRNRIVVVSAMSGVTDMLVSCYQKAAQHDASYHQVIQQLEHRHMEAIEQLVPFSHQIDIKGKVKLLLRELEDICQGVFLLDELSDGIKARFMSYGELLSSALISVAFQHLELPNTLIDSRDFIITDSNYLNAKVEQQKTYARIQAHMPDAPLVIAPGFISRTEAGKTTVLGRGGSDYTASIFAAALKAERLEIWSDVDGMYTADPRKVKAARPIKELSYKEAMELAYFGAKVLYPPTISPLVAANIPLMLKNTFNPSHAGTLITAAPAPGPTIKGVSCIDNITLITLSGSGMVGVPGIAMRMFKAVAKQNINIYFITQSSSEQSITIAMADPEGQKALHALTEEFAQDIAINDLDPVSLESQMSIVAIVGNGMIQHPGIAGTIFSILGNHSVNIRAIAQGATERNISLVVRGEDAVQAANLLHDSFFLEKSEKPAEALA